ncbi:MAG: molybdenum cofactor guanylyltransferase [Pirellula sp.]
MDHRPPLRAYILAGGKSSRFGSDKARVVIDGTPNLRFLADRLAKYHLTTTIVSQSRSDYSDLDVRTIPDFERDAGPLAGTITALHDAKSLGAEWSLILTCDLLWHNDTWIERMLSAIQSSHASSHPQPLVWLFHRDSFSPFPGLYHADAWLSARQSWDQGVRSMRGWLQPKTQDHEMDSVGSRVPNPGRPDPNVEGIGHIHLHANDLPGSFNTSDELREQLKRTDNPLR